MSEKTRHDSDCHYHSVFNHDKWWDVKPWDGICTCGYGLQQARGGCGDDGLMSDARGLFEEDRPAHRRTG